jgi:hypothetical protein
MNLMKKYVYTILSSILLLTSSLWSQQISSSQIRASGITDGWVLSASGGHTIWIAPSGAIWPSVAGIPCYSGSSSWCSSFNAGNQIPTSYLNLSGYLTNSSASGTYAPLFTVSTSGTGGPATYSSNVINIPVYQTALGFTPAHSGANSDITSLSSINFLIMSGNLSVGGSATFNNGTSNSFALPLTRGTANQSLESNGDGTTSWGNSSSTSSNPNTPTVYPIGGTTSVASGSNDGAGTIYFTKVGTAAWSYTLRFGGAPYPHSMFCVSQALPETITGASNNQLGPATFAITSVSGSSPTYTFTGTPSTSLPAGESITMSNFTAGLPATYDGQVFVVISSTPTTITATNSGSFASGSGTGTATEPGSYAVMWSGLSETSGDLEDNNYLCHQ